MITIRNAAGRGATRLGWLDSRHSFSFGDYHDPAHMGFGPLRVINEDRVAPGGGFPPHAHRHMEIVSYVLDGALEHKDSLGTGSIIRPGEIQRMSAGTGIRHSEFNASSSSPVHFLQIWIVPESTAIAPSYQQARLSDVERRGWLGLAVAGSGGNGTVSLHRDVDIYTSLLAPSERVRHGLRPDRLAWLQVARGAVALNGHALAAGDGAAARDEPTLDIEATADAEIVLFDMR